MLHVVNYKCYQFRILRNLRIDIKDRLEEHSQSIVLDIHIVLKINKNQYLGALVAVVLSIHYINGTWFLVSPWPLFLIEVENFILSGFAGKWL